MQLKIGSDQVRFPASINFRLSAAIVEITLFMFLILFQRDLTIALQKIDSKNDTKEAISLYCDKHNNEEINEYEQNLLFLLY